MRPLTKPMPNMIRNKLTILSILSLPETYLPTFTYHPLSLYTHAEHNYNTLFFASAHVNRSSLTLVKTILS